MTLDVEMPRMDGLDFLERVMRLRPMPVIMVSTLTARGTEATIQALELGAVDCIAKPSAGDADTLADLPQRVRAAARARLLPRGQPSAPKPVDTAPDYRPSGSVVAIGASTGGVEAMIEILSRYPANCPPTVMTLHMPSPFTTSFSNRLNQLCAAKVCEATDGAPLSPGVVYLAPGGAHLEVASPRALRCRVSTGEPVSGHRPSVDVLFSSVAKASGANSIGVILTGMGKDGAKGLLEMRQAGARTFGQDEASSVVYGMPKVALEIGAVEKQVSLGRMAGQILASAALRT
jgi:two-component system chemotaxis response regulator CheB